MTAIIKMELIKGECFYCNKLKVCFNYFGKPLICDHCQAWGKDKWAKRNK